MTISGIYQILNTWTEIFYIGSAIDLNSRWSQHKWELKNNRHGNTYLQRSWNKYGELSFEFILIEVCPKEKLIECEQSWIEKLNACDKSIGYNMRPRAASNLGIKWTDAHKAKISASKRGTTQAQDKIDERNAANRKLDKWPHLFGCRCKCRECKDKRNAYGVQYRNDHY